MLVVMIYGSKLYQQRLISQNIDNCEEIMSNTLPSGVRCVQYEDGVVNSITSIKLNSLQPCHSCRSLKIYNDMVVLCDI